MTNTILAPEILAHLTVARALRVGDLAVFTDYRGRHVGARVTHILGETIVGKCVGLGTQHGVYAIGDLISRDACDVKRAV